jgi:hypothetical protein
MSTLTYGKVAALPRLLNRQAPLWSALALIFVNETTLNVTRLSAW